MLCFFPYIKVISPSFFFHADYVPTCKMQNPSPKFKSFASIEHFQKAKKQLNTYLKGKPDVAAKPLTLRGTVKLHGTHGDIVFQLLENENTGPKPLIHFQSRNRVLHNLKDQDNCGFARFMEEIGYDVLDHHLFRPAVQISKQSPVTQSRAVDSSSDDEEDNSCPKDQITTLMISGEFCGGSIQKGVALCDLQRMFVIFSVKINGFHVDPYAYRTLQIPEKQIHNIYRIDPFRLSWSLSDLTIVDKLQVITDDVERECPFAKSFGVSGTGEGVVWCVEELAHRSRFYFKVKGEEHKTTRVITLKAKSSEEIAALQNVKLFAAKALPEARLHQGLDYLREMNMEISRQNTSVFMKWIVADVLKEESDEIKVAGVDTTKLKKELSTLAIGFYQKTLTSNQSN